MADDSEASIKIYLREIRQTPLLTPQEEIELAARIKKGDQKARAWMIKANLRLVVKIAHDYSNLGLPLKGTENRLVARAGDSGGSDSRQYVWAW
jgi:DNA-directed RNA polymerase sigma subunit (sigma70/sigma32)